MLDIQVFIHCPFFSDFLSYISVNALAKIMSGKIKKESVTVSFRISPNDKKNLDFIIKMLNTNKSEFFRKNVNTLLFTLKIKNHENRI